MSIRKNTSAAPESWRIAGCASLPVDELRVLAGLRREPGIRVVIAGARAWVRWSTRAHSDRDSGLVARTLMAARDAELFVERGGTWYRLGAHLPAFEVPFRDGADGAPLDAVVIPSPVTALRPGRPIDVGPVPINLVRDESEQPRPTAALGCSLDALAQWVESAPSLLLAPLACVWREVSPGHDGSGHRDAPPIAAMTLVLGAPGARLPVLSASTRYWGGGTGLLMVPLGYRIEPNLPEETIRGVLGAGPDDLVFLAENRVELVPRRSFRPLTRAGVRLAVARWGALSRAKGVPE